MDKQKEAITKATANQIRYFRQKQGLSQEQLALKAEMNPAYLGQVERGLKCPTIDTLYKIVCALELSLSEFFAFDAKSGANETTGQLQNMLSMVPPDKAQRFIEIAEQTLSLIINP